MHFTSSTPSPSRGLFKPHRYAVSSLLALMALLPTSGWAQTVKLATSMGDVVLELNAELAPKTVANFVQYVRSGHYDGTVFHRVIETFMIQAGGHRADMTEKPTRAPIALESSNGLSNMRGTIAMARTGNPNSATATPCLAKCLRAWTWSTKFVRCPPKKWARTKTYRPSR
jgi:hypothetical protein